MKALKKIVSHLGKTSRIPPEMNAYCAGEINKINQLRFKYLSLLFIVAITVILLVYVVFIVSIGPEAISMAYFIADALSLLFLLACHLLWRFFPFFREKGFLPLLYTVCCTIFTWTIVLSVLDNNVTCLIIALLLLPMGLIIKPRMFILIQAFLLLPLLLAIPFLQMGGFSLLVNGINTLLCMVVSAYICRITYNLIVESVVKTRSIELQNIELNELTVQLKSLSETDALTSLLNRRKFNEVMPREWNRAKRSAQSLVLIFFDIDYFKNYNDNYGHQMGDECLTLLGKTLREKFQRASEYTARYGGEEFALILANANESAGIAACERLFASIAALKIPHAHSKAAAIVTVSAGIAATVPKEEDLLQDFLKKADTALYAAKETGRNRYVVAPPDSSVSNAITGESKPT